MTKKSKKVFIIAEAGVNHNGSLVTARKIIDLAAKAGADAVKFQTFKAENLVTKSALKATYQKLSTDKDESQLAMLKKLEFGFDAHKVLIDHCKKSKIIFISSPFDLESIDLLNKLGLKTFKIPSGEITNLPYLRKIGRLNRKVILSTGMSDMKEIGHALKVLVDSGTSKQNIAVLHCNTEYPTPIKDVNLLAMVAIKKAFGVEVGYSDHTNGIEIAVAATALGAKIIEKHFTLNKNLPGPDHKASLEPDDLKKMVTSIRNIEIAMGEGIKKPSLSETKNILVVRKSIVAACNIHKGEILNEHNITSKRPATGISPMLWNKVIGSYAKKDFQKDELIAL